MQKNKHAFQGLLARHGVLRADRSKWLHRKLCSLWCRVPSCSL